MDTVKSSHPSKGTEPGDSMAPEETAPVSADRQREEDMPKGNVAVTSASHRMAQDKHKYNTIGHQQLGNLKKSRGIDFSTVRGTASSAKPRGAIMQVFFSQNVTQEDRAVGGKVQVDTLKQVLDYLTLPSDLAWTWGEGGTERKLNQSWTDIVKSHESMLKTQRHQQEAIWELISTELTNINKLNIAKELVLGALSHCHKYGFLQEVTPTMVFYNLPSILEAHRLFWQEVMYPMLQEVRLTGRPFDPLKLEAGCLQFPERFSAYFEYCWEKDRNVEFTRRLLDTSPHFHTYISWVESHPHCGRMRLGDMQAKPLQRITKYPLLLKAILKNTDDLPTRNALQRMLNSVEHFLTSINDHLQLKDDELGLSAVAQKIEGYKIEGLSEEIDKHIQDLCCFDLTSPIRGVGPNIIRKQILDETLKVGGRKDSKELVVLLFTDVLLMAKTQKKSDKLKVVRPPLALERIHCIELRDGYSFVLVEVGDLGCAVSVYCLSTHSPDSCLTWVSALREAQTTLDTLRTNEANKTQTNTEDKELSGSFTQNKLINRVKEEDSNSQSESDSGFPSLTQIDSISFNGTQTINNLEQSNGQQLMENKSSTPFGQPNSQTQSAHEGWFPEKKESGLIKSDEGEPLLRNFSERRVTWKHVPQASLNPKDNTNQDLLPGKHTEKNSQSIPRSYFFNELPNTTQHGNPIEPHSYDGSQDQLVRNETLSINSGEDFLSESGNFIRKLASPRLRRQRPNNPQPSVLLDSGKEPEPNATPDTSLKGAHISSIKPQDTHRVLKLGSLKNNKGGFWCDTEKMSSPDPQTIWEPVKRPDVDLETKPKLKKQRSVSVTEISFSCASSLSTQKTAQDSQVSSSPLLDLLQRAKQREHEHKLGKEGKAKTRNFSLPSTPPSSPSPSASEGDREAEGTSTTSAQRRTQNEKKGRKNVIQV
ncbi:rho guanine nucleotide exchange factor 12 isoform X2 [Triplophysa dalaica]|uniref:rho guanine nucleotide exchange factor 12 isoform X2 n=1 Tax=Triplophysa dalaica TaxID=1582913 RepID=UPI0024DFD04A|nr:rho guanine nucleotide exchange factor 12 isoform X2 [Triplophysa dalaica]